MDNRLKAALLITTLAAASLGLGYHLLGGGGGDGSSTGTFYVEGSYDDAMEYGDNYFENTALYVRVYSYSDPGTSYYICGGWRFRNITIPQGATIQQANFSGYVQSSSYDDMNCKIYGNDVDDAEDFNENQNIIDTGQRPRTTAFVSWIQDGLGSGWVKKTELQSVVEEIVGRATWTSGNDIVLLFIANEDVEKNCKFYSYDQDSQYAAELEVEWTTGGGGDTQPPTSSNEAANTTVASMPCEWSVKWTDDVNMSGYIFGSNNTGSWVNMTWTAWTPPGTPEWSNVTKTLNSTVGVLVQAQVWANDTSDNWAASSIINVTTTEAEEPSFMLLEAGNLNDPQFGPYTSGHYYRNGTWQTEDWMYIEANITASFTFTPVLLEWRNETGWYNHTMNQNTTEPDFFYLNLTGQPAFDGYTFNVYAKNEVGDYVMIYSWRYVDYQEDWGEDPEGWRKIVGLNSTPELFNYTAYYLSDANYSHVLYRVLPHEQPTDGTTSDTGLMYLDPPSGKGGLGYCSGFVGFYPDETFQMNDTLLYNVYIHLWWNTANDEMRFGYEKEDGPEMSYDFDWYYNTDAGDSRKNITLSAPLFNYTDFHLEAKWCDIENQTFSDNEMNLFCWKAYQSGQWPEILSTPHYSSFIIFNMPTNTTYLDTLDSDEDGLSDYEEMFTYYTDPFDVDTDAGGKNDGEEVDDGSDPLIPADDTMIYNSSETGEWNVITLWVVDYGKNFSQVNASLWYDDINYTYFVVYWNNGSARGFKVGEVWNVSVVISDDATRIEIWALCEGTWNHHYD